MGSTVTKQEELDPDCQPTFFRMPTRLSETVFTGDSPINPTYFLSRGSLDSLGLNACSSHGQVYNFGVTSSTSVSPSLKKNIEALPCWTATQGTLSNTFRMHPLPGAAKTSWLLRTAEGTSGAGVSQALEKQNQERLLGTAWQLWPWS